MVIKYFTNWFLPAPHLTTRTQPPAGQTIDLFILLWAFLEHVIFHRDIFRVVRGPKMPHFHTHSTLTIVSFHISAAKKIDHDGLLRENWDQVEISRYSKQQLWMGATTSDSAALTFIFTMDRQCFENISLKRATLFLLVVLHLIFGFWNTICYLVPKKG